LVDLNLNDKIMHKSIRVYPEDLELGLNLSTIFSSSLKIALINPTVANRIRSIHLGRDDSRLMQDSEYQTIVTSIRMTATQYYSMCYADLKPSSIIQVGLELVRQTWQPCAGGVDRSKEAPQDATGFSPVLNR
jgi:hypothetical protein